MTCGSLEFYDKANDKITPKVPQPLPKTDRTYSNVTTTDDPNIRNVCEIEACFPQITLIFVQFAQQNAARVFATDTILAALMASPRSVYSFDMIAYRVEDKIFFDKSDSSVLGLLKLIG